MQSRWRNERTHEINFAPLLDVIFCLLFFFVVATSLRQEREVLNISLAQTRQETTRIQQPRMLEVVITRENKIIFRGEETTGKRLAVELKKARAADPAHAGQVLIRIDGKADFQTVVEVCDACAEAGMKAVPMQMQPVPPGGPESGEDAN